MKNLNEIDGLNDGDLDAAEGDAAAGRGAGADHQPAEPEIVEGIPPSPELVSTGEEVGHLLTDLGKGLFGFKEPPADWYARFGQKLAIGAKPEVARRFNVDIETVAPLGAVVLMIGGYVLMNIMEKRQVAREAVGPAVPEASGDAAATSAVS